MNPDTVRDQCDRCGAHTAHPVVSHAPHYLTLQCGVCRRTWVVPAG